jgi:soluble lytic murein transglycosylase
VGERPKAEAAWRAVLAADPLSYYAIASARRLGANGWRPPPAADQFQHFPQLDSALTRIATLRAAGMTEEAGWESDWLLSRVGGAPEELLALADGFRRSGQPSVAVSLARRALRAGAPGDARTYRLIYPLLHGDDVRSSAADAGLAPSVVAGLIRQESVWEASARSRVGALGLMQLMPATGLHLAGRLGMRMGWSSDRLLDPSLNIRFGTQYLAATLRQFDGDLNRALAGYNAGPGRVAAWAKGPAATDSDLFVERITFQETRDYVRIVQRNVAVYRALYPDATP